ncbi:hypothetical protein E2C01_074077 [Portunus trituberculatus]|uniref:Uncharacterized protein n=1 Tax=Portunus trituberculatus TaxID=210409 RepID=A0A5B7IDD8_PORTR|nr:hypothetical protein [Portunus trituberculatus]
MMDTKACVGQDDDDVASGVGVGGCWKGRLKYVPRAPSYSRVKGWKRQCPLEFVPANVKLGVSIMTQGRKDSHISPHISMLVCEKDTPQTLPMNLSGSEVCIET